MLRRWDMDLVAHGPSLHDDDSYYLIRAFADVDDRRRREDAFYGSAEWREGPREAILSFIESYTTIVLELDRATIDGLRTDPHPDSKSGRGEQGGPPTSWRPSSVGWWDIGCFHALTPADLLPSMG